MWALTFEYHGIAEMEVESAKRIGAEAEVADHRFVRLPDLKEAEDLGVRFGNRPPTYIPLRNSIFYSFAASYAEEVGAQVAVGGHNKDDLAAFDDASPSFFKPLEAALREASPALRKNGFRVVRPLESKTKPQVIRLAVKLGVPLGLTWSCHRDGSEPCWECEGCLNRTRSCRRAKVADPLVSAGGKLLKR